MDRTTETEAARLFGPLRDRFRYRFAFLRAKLRPSYFFRHFTLKRALNFLLVKAEKALHRQTMKGRPYHIFVDPGNICNFKCPLCITGRDGNRRPKALMSFERFEEMMEPLADTALVVNLYNWGEPFLNKNIWRMIAYARDRGIATRLSSNLYQLTPEDLERIVDSGLEHIKVSLDGTSEETFTKYRVGGHYERVFENLKTLVELKRAKKAVFPVIEWQFLVMKHNEHEMETAQKLARRIGVDVLTFGTIGLGESPYNGTYNAELAVAWLPEKNREYRHRYEADALYREPCYFLWESITLNHDGGLAPCCMLDDPRHDFGNLTTEPIDAIWNNELYKGSRREFHPKYASKSGCRSVCAGCKIFRKPK